MSSQDLQAVVKTQKAFIKELLDRLERKDVKDNCDMTHKLEDIREIIEDTEIDYEKTCYLVKDILDK